MMVDNLQTPKSRQEKEKENYFTLNHRVKVGLY